MENQNTRFFSRQKLVSWNQTVYPTARKVLADIFVATWLLALAMTINMATSASIHIE